MGHLRDRWQVLPDHRKPNNNTRYTIGEAALSAFSVFFTQSPSFLAYQRDMHKRKGRDNAQSLFKVEQIPSDNQIRNLLDPIAPEHFQAEFEWVQQELQHPNHLAGFAGVLALILLGVGLAGPKSQAGRWWAGGGLALSVLLLGTTFSRGGWIAFGLAAAYVLVCGLGEGRGRVAAAAGLMTALAPLFYLGFGPWIAQRIALSEATWVEIKSLQDQALVAEGAWELFRAQPALGVGLGNYMQGAAGHLSGQVKAPVHNTMAMALSELGLMGGVLVVGLYTRVIWLAWRARADLAAAVGVALALCLLVANAFDLYAWGLAPGRLFLGLLCGLCAGDSAGVDSKPT